MSIRIAATAAGMLACAAGAPALGQTRFVIADRTNDSLWVLADHNHNGVIEEPGEVHLLFSAANAAGTPGPLNPTALEVRRDGLIVYGDQDSTRKMLVGLRDLNLDGDAQDPGESWVIADPTNASAISFAFPTGIAFDSLGRPVVVNAGNALGNDGVYRLDIAGDGDAQEPGEVSTLVGTGNFQGANGPYSPQELVPVAASFLLRNSSAGLNGVFRLADLSADGDMDDAGELAGVWTSGSSGVTPGAGFALEPDRARPGAVYTQQVVSTPSAGTDQIVRLVDWGGEGQYDQPGDAAVVYQTSEAGFTAIDLYSLPDGRLLVTDNSGNRVIVLADLNSDTDFQDTGERTDYLANTAGIIAAARQIAAYPCPGDFDRNWLVGTADITGFLSAWFADLANGTTEADFDRNGVVGTADITSFLNAWFASLNLC
ncbi:MAG TPA: hypothetical protein VD963_08995 [Phycisphaerales bacterium]|nr:hypothetical protein [Phycisphaerales bacterium]